MEIFCCCVQGPFEISSVTAVATVRSIPGATEKVAHRALTCAWARRLRSRPAWAWAFTNWTRSRSITIRR
eukprot:9138561-Pyramimonas_sp.AAC.1